MSLLQKASIITTPTAYAEDYLYSIKPAYALGSELVTNGDFSNGTNNWTPNANATLSVENGRLKVAISGAGSGYPSQDITTEVGKKYRITANAFIGTSTKVSLYSVVFGFNDLSVDGSYDLTFKATSTTTQIRLYVYGDGTYGFWDNVSVKEVTDADFDFDRNSTGTRVNEDYLIEDVPYNLVSNSENFSVFTKVNATVTTNQTLAPDGTLTADKIVFNGTANARVEQNLTASIMGTPNTQSVFLKTESGTANIDIGLATHDVTTVAVTSEWKRFTHTGEGQYPRMKSDSAVTIFAWGMQVVKGDQPKDYLKTTDRLDIPRIDYTNGEPSILLEPQRQNLIPNSTTTIANNTTIEYNNILSPENILNGVKVTSTALSAYVRTDTVAMTSNNTISVFLKAGTSNYAQVLGAGNAGDFFNINLDNFTIGNTGATTSNVTIQQYSNNWYRCSAKFAGYTGNTTIRLLLSDSDSNFNATSSTTGKFLYYYGLQLETGSYATSLIHTSGSAVTRSADLLPNPLGAVGTPTGNKAVIYLEVASTETTNRNFVGFVNGTTNQYGLYHWGATDNYKFGFNTWNGDSYGIIGADYLLNGEFNKIAGLFDFTNFTNNKLYINGKQQSISQVRNVTVQRSAAGLGITAPTSNQVPIANFKSVMMFDEELTDEELEKLTGYNNHELYMNYYNRLSYLGLAEEYNVESDINNYIL